MGNSNKGNKLYIAVTAPGGAIPLAAHADLDQAGYVALNWVEVAHVGTIGSFDADEGMATYDPLTGPTLKAKGNINAGDPEVSWGVSIDASGDQDDGQLAMIAAGKTRYPYAFKKEFNDKPVAAGTNTIQFSRGKVKRVMTVAGAGNDYVTQTTTLGLEQIAITVDPTTGS